MDGGMVCVQCGMPASGARGFDLELHLPTGSVSARAIFYGRRLVVLAVATPHHADGGLRALIGKLPADVTRI